jgi:hypothetical protein
VEAFLNSLGPLPAEGFSVGRPDGKKATGDGRLWTGVDGRMVAELLGSLKFPEGTFDADKMKDYIIAQLAIGELTEWTIILPAGRGSLQALAGIQIGTGKRANPKPNDTKRELSFQTILSPGDESLDLSPEEFAYAFDLTKRSRTDRGKPAPDRPAGPDIRIARGRRPQRALLLIYPIDPVDAGMDDLGMPLIGIVVSFPESATAKSVTYKYNSVERRLDLQ